MGPARETLPASFTCRLNVLPRIHSAISNAMIWALNRRAYASPRFAIAKLRSTLITVHASAARQAHPRKPCALRADPPPSTIE